MKRRFGFIKVILFCLFLLNANHYLKAQEVMTLPKAIAIALENSYDIKIANKQIEIAEKSNTWARAGRTPTITINGNFSNNLTDDNNPASFLQGTFYNGSLGATADANFIVYAGGRVKILKEQLNMAAQQELLYRSSGIHDLMQIVYDQYYGVLFQEEQLGLLRETYNLSRNQLDYELVKKDYGSSNGFNIVQFESALLADSINISKQKQQIDIAKRNLYNTLNIDGDTIYLFEETLSIEDEAIDAEALKALLNEENYTLKSLEILVALNQLNTELARAARKPTIAINASLGFAENAFKFFADNPNTGEPFDLIFSNRLTASIGATMSWTAYDGGVLRDDVQNALIQQDIDQLAIEETKANIIRQLDLLVNNYENQRQQIYLSDEQILLAKKNLEITEERFKGGQLSSIDFRNIQLQVLNAYFSKASAIYDMILIKTDIDYLVGKFSQ